MARTVVYVSNADSAEISVLALDEASGALVAALMLVTYVPGFAMWLPNLILK